MIKLILGIIGVIGFLVFYFTAIQPYMTNPTTENSEKLVDKTVHYAVPWLGPLEWASNNPGPLATIVVLGVVGFLVLTNRR